MLTPFFVRTEVKKEKILKKIHPMQVVRLSAVKNYTTITLNNGRAYTVRSSLVNALSNFPPKMFVKMDRAEVVSVFYIDNITREHLIMGGKTVSIPRSYFKYVIAGINIVE